MSVGAAKLAGCSFLSREHLSAGAFGMLFAALSVVKHFRAIWMEELSGGRSILSVTVFHLQLCDVSSETRARLAFLSSSPSFSSHLRSSRGGALVLCVHILFTAAFIRHTGTGFLSSWLFFLFRATPAAYGSSQARGQIGADASGLWHSHSNMGS